jgi:N-formylmaleamate deformylase
MCAQSPLGSLHHDWRKSVMTDWFDGYVHANNINHHYYRTGGEKPPVMLLHGVTDNGLCWERVALALAADYDVVMPDARGHGLSEAPMSDLSTQQLSEDVAALIEALGPHRPHLIGHSMGARTAAEVAALYPERVRSLVLEDPAWFDGPTTAEEQERHKLGLLEWHQRAAEQRALSREERLASVHKENPAWTQEDIEPWTDAQSQFHLGVLDPAVSDFIVSWRQRPWREVLQQITCPILLVTAEPERGAIITSEQAQEAARQARDLRIIHISDAGHCIRRDQYEPFVQAVTAFLKEH